MLSYPEKPDLKMSMHLGDIPGLESFVFE